MPWFRVDDGLFLHQKIIKAGNAAMGLWLRAGSWSAHHLTEGFIPDSVIEVLGTGTQRNKLTKVGLWTEVEGGCQFHEWNERQPTRDEVADQRAVWTDRKRKSRAKLLGNSAENSAARPARASENLESSASSQVSGMSHAPVTAPLPFPSLPIEEQETPTGSLARSPRRSRAVQPPLLDVVTSPSPPAPAAAEKARGSRLAEDWRPTEATITWSREWAGQHPGLNVTVEWSKFVDYWSSTPGAKGRKANWDATWRNWLRTATERMPRWKQQVDAPAPLTNAQKRRKEGLSLLAEIQAREAAERATATQRKAIQA